MSTATIVVRLNGAAGEDEVDQLSNLAAALSHETFVSSVGFQHGQFADPAEPVEAILTGRSDVRLQLVAWRAETGTVGYRLTRRDGTGISLSNLQLRSVLPGKAVQGWQHELVAALSTGLYDVEDYR